MIYLGFILDYVFLFFWLYKSYFVINNLDNNSLFSVVVIGLILDFLYQKICLNLFILLAIYIFLKEIKTKKKYLDYQNIVLFIVYFNIMFFLGGGINYIEEFIGSFILQIGYIYYSKWLLK